MPYQTTRRPGRLRRAANLVDRAGSLEEVSG
jgi:hypothetical protein